jgi:hypothetical protein
MTDSKNDSLTISTWGKLIKMTAESMRFLWWRIFALHWIFVLTLFLGIGLLILLLAWMGGMSSVQDFYPAIYMGEALANGVLSGILVLFLFLFFFGIFAFSIVLSISSLLMVRAYTDGAEKYSPLRAFFIDSWSYFWRYIWVVFRKFWFVFWPVLLLLLLGGLGFGFWGYQNTEILQAISLSLLGSQNPELMMQAAQSALSDQIKWALVSGSVIFVLLLFGLIIWRGTLVTFSAEFFIQNPDRKVNQGFEDSIKLVQGSWWRVFAAILCFALPLGILVQGIVFLGKLLIMVGSSFLFESSFAGGIILVGPYFWEYLISFAIAPISIVFFFFLMRFLQENKKI